MEMAIGMIGFLGFFVCIIWLIVRLFKRTDKRPPAVGLLVCFILFVAGAMMMPPSDKDGDSNKNDISSDSSTNKPDASEEREPINLDSIEEAIISAIPQEYQSNKWFYVDCNIYVDESISVDMQIDQGTEDADAALNLAAEYFELAKNEVENSGGKFAIFHITVVNNGSPIGSFSTEDGENFVSISEGKRTEISIS